jgi:hypothetical protein
VKICIYDDEDAFVFLKSFDEELAPDHAVELGK